MSDISQGGASYNANNYKHKFVTRVYYMRIMGTTLCIPPIWSVIQERGELSILVWTLLAINGIAWPHIAVRLSRRAADPAKQEFRNLICDSFAGGFWIAMMHVGIVPTMVFMTVLGADKVAAGGWRLLFQAIFALTVGFLVTWVPLGMPFNPNVSWRTTLLCAPLLFLYNIGLSYLMYRLGQQVVQQNRELKRLSLTDPSLGIPNRRYFETSAQQALDRVKSSGAPASLLLVDVDSFKDVNDVHGHGVGDVVLHRLTTILKSEIHPDDMAARYGGDEFAVLLNDADMLRAESIAKRIRHRVEAIEIENAKDLHCSVSIGVAQAEQTFSSVKEWVAQADSAMYRAKSGGRNQVICNH